MPNLKKSLLKRKKQIRKVFMERKYYEMQDIEQERRLRNMLNVLPKFCHEYFIGIQQRTGTKTRLGYAYDLSLFFEFIKENNPTLRNTEIHDFDLDLLDKLSPFDIEEYMNHLRVYEKDGVEHTNKERGIARKLAAVRSMYNYFYKKQVIKTNPPALVSTPKQHEKNIIRLETDEVVELLDTMESGENLTKNQKVFADKTRVRDLAIVTTLLGTGIRVSELVGLDMNDIDLKNQALKVHRKGGKEQMVYFGDEVNEALLSYLDERKNTVTADENEHAFFLRLRQQRIGVRAVEKLVKKYASTVTPLKPITPHKLRSTYGTTLYKETGDIYLVADVLGHSDINTTRKHYAAQADENRRKAARIVKLRED